MKRSEIERLLPDIYQRTVAPGRPLSAILDVMAGLQRPVERRLADIAASFDAYRCPDPFVPYLARWLDLDRFLARSAGAAPAAGTREGRDDRGIVPLRNLVATAAFLSQWRGTRTGLVRLLETASGVPGFVIDETAAAAVADTGGVERGSVHLRVIAPPEAEPQRDLLQRIIRQDKPAHATWELVFGTPSSGSAPTDEDTMAASLIITAAAPSVRLDATGRGEHRFTVTNTTEADLRLVCAALAEPPALPDWLRLAGDGELALPSQATGQVAVRIATPANIEPGRYKLRLALADADDPGRTLGESASETFEMPAKPPPPPAETRKRFPWWWVVAAAGAGAAIVVVSMMFEEPGQAVNLNLRGQPTAQSSTEHGGEARLAIDGNTSGQYGSGSCTHTALETDPWWRVALGNAKEIERLVLFNRTDRACAVPGGGFAACATRLDGVQVWAGDAGISPQDVRAYLATDDRSLPPGVTPPRRCGGPQAVEPDDATIEIACGEDRVRGDALYVTLPGENRYLTLCEVEAFVR